MDTVNSETADSHEILSVLSDLRRKLHNWNVKYGHPFPGISDGLRAEIRGELIPACRAFANREALIAALPKRLRFAEVGNFFGAFSVKIVEINQPRELHTFDWNLDKMDVANRSFLDKSGVVTFHEGDPSINIRDIPSGFFDIVYLNKSKDYAGVRRELDQWLERLAQDGYLVINDFTAWDPVQGYPYGVLPAVSQFVNEYNLEVVFVSLHPRGFLNIAVRRL